MCGGNKVVTTSALDAVHTTGARIASAGNMYKPSLPLLHCADLVLRQEDRKHKGSSKAAQRVALHQQKRASCCQALAGARPHLSWKAWHLSIACKAKLVTQVCPLEIIFSASRKAFNFLVALWTLTKDTLLSKVPGCTKVAKCSQVTFQQASFISNSVAHVATPLPDALMLSFHGWHRHCCNAKTNEIWASYGAPTQLPQSRTRPWLSSETS